MCARVCSYNCRSVWLVGRRGVCGDSRAKRAPHHSNMPPRPTQVAFAVTSHQRIDLSCRANLMPCCCRRCAHDRPSVSPEHLTFSVLCANCNYTLTTAAAHSAQVIDSDSQSLDDCTTTGFNDDDCWLDQMGAKRIGSHLSSFITTNHVVDAVCSHITHICCWGQTRRPGSRNFISIYAPDIARRPRVAAVVVQS